MCPMHVTRNDDYQQSLRAMIYLRVAENFASCCTFLVSEAHLENVDRPSDYPFAREFWELRSFAKARCRALGPLDISAFNVLEV